MEKAINFKVDEELYRIIKVEVARRGITLKDYVIGLIVADLKKSIEQK